MYMQIKGIFSMHVQLQDCFNEIPYACFFLLEKRKISSTGFWSIIHIVFSGEHTIKRLKPRLLIRVVISGAHTRNTEYEFESKKFLEIRN